MLSNQGIILKKSRGVVINLDIVEYIKEIGTKRPTYGTRRMSAQIPRETGIPVNHKNTANMLQNWLINTTKNKMT